MEFDNLGRQCAHEGCNQKDFLPFKCDMCKLDLCLIHRTYTAHNCVKAAGKDVTSVDCPICNKSFKLTRADNPDIAWESHYANDCTQRSGPAKSKPVGCPVLLCRSILGPSNTFTCTKCNLKVCLSHRTPEDHACKSIVSKKKDAMFQARSNLGVSSTSSGSVSASRSSAPKSTSVEPSKQKSNTSTKKATDSGNSIYGTADRRKKKDSTSGENRGNNSNQPAGLSSGNVADGQCPVCGLYFVDQDLLVTHVNVDHVESFGMPSAPLSLPNVEASSAALIEQCPFCSARFPDAVRLVEHVQSHHPEGNQFGSREQQQQQPTNNGQQPQSCSLC